MIVVPFNIPNMLNVFNKKGNCRQAHPTSTFFGHSKCNHFASGKWPARLELWARSSLIWLLDSWSEPTTIVRQVCRALSNHGWQVYGAKLIRNDRQIFVEKANLLCNIPANLPAELVQTIVVADGVRIERIVSKGHQSPPDFWYDQDQNEWVLLAKGAATLEFPNETLHLKAGDYVKISAHQKHRVAWTTPDEETVWLAIFYS